MADKKFSNDYLYELFKYILWCELFEEEFQLCETHKKYMDWLESTLTHLGDCTKDACSCERCRMFGFEIQAQRIINTLFRDSDREMGIGHCGKRCLSECKYKKKKES